MRKPPLPTMPGRRVLLNLHRGDPAAFGIVNADGVFNSLRVRGLIDGYNQLTDAGRAMISRLTTTPEVPHVA